MSHPEKPADRLQRLPLAESLGESVVGDVVSEADIRVLVDSFYDTILADDMLGPIFERHVQDWSLHLPKMYRFWSTIVLRTGLYAGRPIEVHEALPNLTRAHFDRWIVLWERTVTDVIHPDAHRAFMVSARRMARSMASRLIA
ncbi:MAG: group III truncated hemoglobin [Planctomycetota bacterium]|nr:group III truncated hemoglobin [Planctomycetota bacterium]